MSPDAPTFDLQSHSTYSDGALGPGELVRAAATAGVELLALTDHDTVDGVAEAIAAGARHGTRVVPAVEISTRDRDLREDLHILGYCIDPADAPLGDLLARARASRERRSESVIDALEDLGFAVAREAIDARAAAGESVGRPHLAQAVLAAPQNAARLDRERIADPSAFLEAYLVPGAPGFRPRWSASVPEAIDAIRGAGGIAVWAHPFFDVDDPADVITAIDRLTQIGLGGVECFYPTHTEAQVALIYDHCAERGLLTTGSADFHGPQRSSFNQFRAFSTYGRDPILGRIAA